MIGPITEVKDLVLSGQVKKSIGIKKDAYDNSRLLREIGVSLLLDHDNIVKLKFIYMDAENYYLFFQCVEGGQLLDFIISHGMLNEKLSRKFLRQILGAVDYCHSNSIVHRDLKIENILIDKKGTIQLIDFGLANFIDPYSHLATFCGSLYFAAPEVLGAKKYIGPEVDMWSIGVILYVLVTGKVPFDDMTLPALHKRIKSGIYDPPVGVTPECFDLISKLLVVDPKNRASMEEVKRHPWVMKYHEELPGGNNTNYPIVKLPLNSKVIKRMQGLGFGTESEITKYLDTYLKDNRSQGVQKWSIGGRCIICPESPMFSIYKLTLNKYEKSKNNLKPDIISKNRQISSTLNDKDNHRKSIWNIFNKNNLDSDDTINIPDTSNTEEKENGTIKRHFSSKIISKMMFTRSKRDKNDTAIHISPESRRSESGDLARPSLDISKEMTFSRNSSKTSKKSLDISRESMDITRPSEDDHRISSKSLDLRRDTSSRYSESGFFGTLKFGKIWSRTQMDLKNSKTESRRGSRLFSPSMAAIKTFSSRIFSKKEVSAPSQNIAGAATLDIKTSHLSGIFTIRNTTSLPVITIRQELIKAFSRVPNLEIIEQKGYFFCKYYDTAPVAFVEQKGFFFSLGRKGKNHMVEPIQTKQDSMMKHAELTTSKPKAQFEVFIRKIPFSSMHGIQFNKISGDAYKVTFLEF